MSDSDQREVLGERGEALRRGFSSLGHRLAAEIPLAVSAARQMRARRGLAAAVVALTVVSYLSSVAVARQSDRLFRQQYAADAASLLRQRPRPATFTQRWAATYRDGTISALLWDPLGRFSTPLIYATSAGGRCIGLLIQPVLYPTSNKWSSLRWMAVMFPVGVAALLIEALLLIGLLGWLRDSDRPLRLAAWPGYWKAHYWPVFAVCLISGAWAPVLMFAGVMRHFPFSFSGGPATSVFANLLSGALMTAPAVLALSPFVIVARRVGAGAGIIEGLRLLRERWAALVVLFLVYRVGYEVLAVWDALPGWSQASYRVFLAPGPLVWRAIYWVGLSLLGLWLAYAFMEIAMQQGAKGPAQAQAEAT
jgi:hypothetical protein